MDQNKHKTMLYNKHLLIETNRGVILIDTGSPASFHEASCIEINGREHKVSTSYMGITAQYLSQKIGCQISGLLGMDIMNLYEIYIDIRPVSYAIGDVCFFEPNGSVSVRGKSIMGIPTVEALINGHKALLLFDTGAPISYIDRAYTQCAPISDTIIDFSPLIGCDEFEVDRYMLTTRFDNVYGRDGKSEIAYGNTPPQIAMMLKALQVDGIIGYDLMEKYRIVIDRGRLYFPPQGI